MSAKSDFLEEGILNHVLRNTALASPTTVYVALFTDDPTDAGTGTEVSGGSYARQSVSFGAPTQVSGKAEVSNDAQVSFPEATASWGTVTHFGIFDASTGGNLLYHEALDVQKTIGTGDQANFDAGDLTVREA